MMTLGLEVELLRVCLGRTLLERSMSLSVSCVPHAWASLMIMSSVFSSGVSGIPDIRKYERLE